MSKYPTLTALLAWSPIVVMIFALLFLIFFSSPNKKTKLATLAIVMLFSGDTFQRIVKFYLNLINNQSLNNLTDNTFPLFNLLVAVSVGILLYFFFKFVVTKAKDMPSGDGNNNSTLLLNTVVLTVLGFSLFIVISVFITIPYLNAISKPSIYNQAQLDSAITNVATKTPLSFPLPPDPPSLVVVDPSDPNGKAAGKNLANFIYQAQTNIIHLQAARSSIASKLLTYKNNYNDKETVAHQQIIEEFGLATQNITTDKSLLFDYALKWFIASREKAQDLFDKTQSELKSADQNNFGVVVNIRTQVKQKLQEEAVNPTKDSLPPDFSLLNFTPYPDSLNFRFSVPIMQAPNYDGSNWGIFGLMSQYLIRTGSSELVLLIGMLGFGLLGASLSSFQSSKEDNNIIQSFQSEPLVTNFGSVLIRGFGAAIVVYLCTKAGLAIFSMGTSTTSDTNGYMLLLTCFIGAVYSDRVWAKVSSAFATSPALNLPPVAQPQSGANTLPFGLTPFHTALDVFDPSKVNNAPPQDPPSNHPKP